MGAKRGNVSDSRCVVVAPSAVEGLVNKPPPPPTALTPEAFSSSTLIMTALSTIPLNPSPPPPPIAPVAPPLPPLDSPSKAANKDMPSVPDSDVTFPPSPVVATGNPVRGLARDELLFVVLLLLAVAVAGGGGRGTK